MLSFFAAVSAPLRIRSQNESPGTSWVIIATVIRGVSTVPPPHTAAGVSGLAAGGRTGSEPEDEYARPCHRREPSEPHDDSLSIAHDTLIPSM